MPSLHLFVLFKSTFSHHLSSSTHSRIAKSLVDRKSYWKQSWKRSKCYLTDFFSNLYNAIYPIKDRSIFRDPLVFNLSYTKASNMNKYELLRAIRLPFADCVGQHQTAQNVLSDLESAVSVMKISLR